MVNAILNFGGPESIHIIRCVFSPRTTGDFFSHEIRRKVPSANFIDDNTLAHIIIIIAGARVGRSSRTYCSFGISNKKMKCLKNLDINIYILSNMVNVNRDHLYNYVFKKKNTNNYNDNNNNVNAQQV